MADTTLDSGEPDATQDDLPVSLPSLALDDGTQPSVGDQVELTVKGTVSKIVNDTAMVTPETINGQPIPQPAQSNQDEDLMVQAQAHDQRMMGGQGGY